MSRTAFALLVTAIGATISTVALVVLIVVSNNTETELINARDTALQERNLSRASNIYLEARLLEVEEVARNAEANAADLASRLLHSERSVLRYEDALLAAEGALLACEANAEAAAYRCGWWKRDRDACYCHVHGSECDPTKVDWGGVKQ